MTRVFDDPSQFMENMLEGFCVLYGACVAQVSGGVVRAAQSPAGKVAVVVGGGSGHYPAFCGVVGPGFADGAIVGNIFTSPSAQDAMNVGAAADNGGGVILTAGNYAGDVLHFDEAAEELTRQGISTRTIYVTDDVASAPQGQETMRRGIAGDFVVFKAMSAAAEAGYALDDVLRVGYEANARTRTMGVAFDGCTLPGHSAPLFTVPEGQMGVGLGIHGEPGISEEPVPPAKDLAQLLVDRVTAELPLDTGERVGVILNGLGATKYEELFLLWRHVHSLLTGLGLQIVDPEVGELVTSLDMAGVSLTLVHLDDELDEFWRAPADTPAYKKGLFAQPAVGKRRQVAADAPDKTKSRRECSEKSREHAQVFVHMLRVLEEALVAQEAELGRIDAVAGDGDHGRGMVKGVRAALEAAKHSTAEGAGLEDTMEASGDSWAAKAGGTSGALWGAALASIGASIGDQPEGISPEKLADAIAAGMETIQRRGKAQLGDKTMLDSLQPFVTSLRKGLKAGLHLPDAWEKAAQSATAAALATAELRPKIGRARPLAERSLGTPDAGATSLALVVTHLTPFFADPH